MVTSTVVAAAAVVPALTQFVGPHGTLLISATATTDRRCVLYNNTVSTTTSVPGQ